MSHFRSLITGFGLGAGLMYLVDPDLGKRRRSLVIDQFNHVLHEINDAAEATLRDIGNRAYGTFAEVRETFSGGNNAIDDVIASRVRSKLGRYTSHPAAIEVAIHDGVVTLSGPILAHEVDDLICAINSVRGVHEVINHLDVHESAENIAALQGGRSRRGEPAELNQVYWSPATRIAVGAPASLLMLNCILKRTPAAILFGSVGFFMFLRALTNLEFKRLLGIRGGRGIDI